MAKNKKKKKGGDQPQGPLGEVETLIDAGDNKSAADLLKKLVDDASLSEEDRARAAVLLKGLKPDPAALAFVGVGVLAWIVVFILGVIARS